MGCVWYLWDGEAVPTSFLVCLLHSPSVEEPLTYSVELAVWDMVFDIIFFIELHSMQYGRYWKILMQCGKCDRLLQACQLSAGSFNGAVRAVLASTL